MEETTQFNIRLSQILIDDLKFVGKHLNINRNEWLKYKIAEAVSEEKLRIIEEIERAFAYGRITETEFENKMGFEPTRRLKRLRDSIALAPQKYFSNK
ncbi:MAG: hypothetical protein KJ597_04005 [Nanoarchaeota archaeon]|nr:hypothetical protein [Nanoarchaeota archaeon]MBU1622711.1 hypothetical protein [Nanoarchaeota archaeon]